MDEPEWIDDGPVLRPYAVARGRTPPSAESFDLLALIVATGTQAPDAADLGPEHHTLLSLVSRARPVVEVASDIDLPLGLIRLFLADLLSHGLILVRPSVETPEAGLLQEVIKGLRAL